MQGMRGRWIRAYSRVCVRANSAHEHRRENQDEQQEQHDLLRQSELGAAQPKIKAAMQAGGDALIGFQAYGDEVNFFRLVITQGDARTEDLLDTMLDSMVAHAEAL